MSNEQNKALMRRFLEASTAKDLTDFQDMMSSDFVAHLPGGAQNRDGFLEQNRFFAAAFSYEFLIEEMIAEGDKVVARTKWRGIHDGEFQGHPATNKQIEINAIIIDRIRDGKVVEHWSVFDMMSMMQQLGLD